MLFHTWTFAAFALFLYPLYWMLRRREQNLLLLGASWFFYGYWDWRFLGLIWASTLVDYFAAIRIEENRDPGRRRVWLLASVGTNLGILGFFKYWNFFSESAVSALAVLTLPGGRVFLYFQF